jgi:hypothetical protein
MPTLALHPQKSHLHQYLFFFAPSSPLQPSLTDALVATSFTQQHFPEPIDQAPPQILSCKTSSINLFS